MTVRSREEDFASSGPIEFCPSFDHMSWTSLDSDHWDQPDQDVPFGYPLETSPDSFSECAFSDCSDMSGLTWSQSQASSSPSNWSQIPSMDNSTYPHSSEGQWSPRSVPVTSQNIAALEAAAWPQDPDISVDLGLSPVLSHETQSTRTLHSVPEQDAYSLPPGLDFPYTAEPSWHGPFIYSSPDISTHTSPELGYPYSFDYSASSAMGCSGFPSVAPYQGTYPVFHPHGGQAAHSGYTYPAQATPMRLILPRSEGPAVPSQPAPTSHRVLRPNVPDSHRSPSTTRSVSNAVGSPQDARKATVSAVGAPLSSAANAHSRPTKSLPPVADPTAEEFSAFIRFDQDDHSMMENYAKRTFQSGGMAVGYETPGANGPMYQEAGKSLLQEHQLPANKSVQSGTEEAITATSSSESDEGRHRTHPDYAKPPHPDGLYRCPYKAKECCSHKPTKLKCNYDKYIDSHVKPFRCKFESCSKQEFSSTACLLRHEREAHGMHGHGDRPHLCYYSGCERGVPGNGFPRRYNLFDHMKRVHDHKEDALDSAGSPILGGETQKRIKGAKRKPSSPVISEPAGQRQKTMKMPEQQYQVGPPILDAHYPVGGPYVPLVSCEPRQKHRMPYSQWTSNGA